MRSRTMGFAQLSSVLALLVGCSGGDIGDPGFKPSGVGTGTGSGSGTSTPGTSNGNNPGGSSPNTGTGSQGTGSPSTGGSTTPVGNGSIVVSGPDTPAPNVGEPSPMDLQGAPIYTRFMRLTNEQWERSVKDLLKLSAPPGMAEHFEQPVEGATDFNNNEHVLTVTRDQWDHYRVAAEQLSDQVVKDSAALSRIYSGTNAGEFIEAFGRRVFRRPLTAEEKGRYQDLYQVGTGLSGNASEFAKGTGLVIRAMLQSPFFLYRTELSPKGSALSGYEIASKLSFLLRGTTPTDKDLDDAKDGKLDSEEGVLALAESMLAEPEAREVFKRFHGEMLHFTQFNAIDKTGVPDYTTALNEDYKESSYLFFDRIFQKGLGLKDILTSTTGFVNGSLAKFYGFSDVRGDSFVEKDLGPERPGYFTQLPYLTLHALNNDPDSVLRGRDINLGMLCITLGPPAAVPAIPALKPGQTNRERMTDLTQGCGGVCHNSYLNPVGFAFENFDGMGRLRDTDNGKPVDTTGSYPFTEGVRDFSGAPELMQRMAEGTQAHACYSKKLASFMLQRDIIPNDVPLLETLAEASKVSSVKELVLNLIKNPAFRTRVQ